MRKITGNIALLSVIFLYGTSSGQDCETCRPDSLGIDPGGFAMHWMWQTSDFYSPNEVDLDELDGSVRGCTWDGYQWSSLYYYVDAFEQVHNGDVSGRGWISERISSHWTGNFVSVEFWDMQQGSPAGNLNGKYSIFMIPALAWQNYSFGDEDLGGADDCPSGGCDFSYWPASFSWVKNSSNHAELPRDWDACKESGSMCMTNTPDGFRSGFYRFLRTTVDLDGISEVDFPSKNITKWKIGGSIWGWLGGDNQDPFFLVVVPGTHNPWEQNPWL